MRITRHELQTLINEEISAALLRSENRRLTEAVGGDLYEMDAASLLDFAEAYSSLGAAVQEQLRDVLDEGETASINPNALDVIERQLGGMNQEIDTAIEAWRAANLED